MMEDDEDKLSRYFTHLRYYTILVMMMITMIVITLMHLLEKTKVDVVKWSCKKYKMVCNEFQNETWIISYFPLLSCNHILSTTKSKYTFFTWFSSSIILPLPSGNYTYLFATFFVNIQFTNIMIIIVIIMFQWKKKNLTKKKVNNYSPLKRDLSSFVGVHIQLLNIIQNIIYIILTARL